MATLDCILDTSFPASLSVSPHLTPHFLTSLSLSLYPFPWCEWRAAWMTSFSCRPLLMVRTLPYPSSCTFFFRLFWYTFSARFGDFVFFYPAAIETRIGRCFWPIMAHMSLSDKSSSSSYMNMFQWCDKPSKGSWNRGHVPERQCGAIFNAWQDIWGQFLSIFWAIPIQVAVPPNDIRDLPWSMWFSGP